MGNNPHIFLQWQGIRARSREKSEQKAYRGKAPPLFSRKKRAESLEWQGIPSRSREKSEQKAYSGRASTPVLAKKASRKPTVAWLRPVLAKKASRKPTVAGHSRPFSRKKRAKILQWQGFVPVLAKKASRKPTVAGHLRPLSPKKREQPDYSGAPRPSNIRAQRNTAACHHYPTEKQQWSNRVIERNLPARPHPEHPSPPKSTPMGKGTNNGTKAEDPAGGKDREALPPIGGPDEETKPPGIMTKMMNLNILVSLDRSYRGRSNPLEPTTKNSEMAVAITEEVCNQTLPVQNPNTSACRTSRNAAAKNVGTKIKQLHERDEVLQIPSPGLSQDHNSKIEVSNQTTDQGAIKSQGNVTNFPYQNLKARGVSWVPKRHQQRMSRSRRMGNRLSTNWSCLKVKNVITGAQSDPGDTAGPANPPPRPLAGSLEASLAPAAPTSPSSDGIALAISASFLDSLNSASWEATLDVAASKSAFTSLEEAITSLACCTDWKFLTSLALSYSSKLFENSHSGDLDLLPRLTQLRLEGSHPGCGSVQISLHLTRRSHNLPNMLHSLEVPNLPRTLILIKAVRELTSGGQENFPRTAAAASYRLLNNESSVAARGIGPTSGYGGMSPHERASARSASRLSSRDGGGKNPPTRSANLGWTEKDTPCVSQQGQMSQKAKDLANEELRWNEQDQSIASHLSENRDHWHPQNEQTTGAQEGAVEKNSVRQSRTSLMGYNPATRKPRYPVRGEPPRRTLSPSRNNKKELLSPTPKRVSQPGHQNKTQGYDGGPARAQLHPDPHQTRKTQQKQISLPELKKQPKKCLRNYPHP
ncbi:uncharacterized protein G2W53_026069 [Senna tora]|uniref:Uncharacterized protein n=1 Tax=Senna tora TaxID=362788 RepID=A0A834TGM2_9FABA|nr:uncharacterized protein G2W53_026069 [Senna tora]